MTDATTTARTAPGSPWCPAAPAVLTPEPADRSATDTVETAKETP